MLFKPNNKMHTINIIRDEDTTMTSQSLQKYFNGEKVLDMFYIGKLYTDEFNFAKTH